MSGAPLHASVRFFRDPALPGVEARCSAYSHHAFRLQTHKACTVALVETGSTRFSLGPGIAPPVHTAHAGQVVVIAPEIPHACNPDPGTDFSYRLVAISVECLAQTLGVDFLARFPRPVLDDTELFTAFAHLHEAFAQGAPTDLKATMLRSCLRRLYLHHATTPPPRPKTRNSAVDTACAHIAANIDVLTPLPELARLCGLSPHHFLRVFKAATGLTPHAYQLQQTIERAKVLLAAGTPICQTALQTGFADQSHFSRFFRQFTGATPHQYLDAGPHHPLD